MCVGGEPVNLRPHFALLFGSLVSLLALAGCNDASTVPRRADAGLSTDASAATDAPPRDAPRGDPPPMDACDRLVATVRDFREDHVDFENLAYRPANSRIAYPGLVEARLDAEGKPVHAAAGATPMTAGPAIFREWYRDVPGVNEAVMVEIPLTPTADGNFVFDSDAFYPIDGRAFGNGTYYDGPTAYTHNYHFTTEIHTRFRYQGGEVLTFRGDDDLWIFVEGELALDLGGLHEPVEGTIRFDELADRLGLVPGNDYRLDLFHAERQSVGSNFRIETSIECFVLI